MGQKTKWEDSKEAGEVENERRYNTEGESRRQADYSVRVVTGVSSVYAITLTPPHPVFISVHP